MDIKEIYENLIAKEEKINEQIDSLHSKESKIFDEIHELYKKNDEQKEIKKIEFYKLLDEINVNMMDLLEKRRKILEKKNEIEYICAEKIEGSNVDIVKFFAEKGKYNYTICLHGKNEQIGKIDYRENAGKPEKDWIADIGYHIDKEYTGRGYATEALKLLTDKLYKDGITNVYIATNQDNKASRRIIEKFGGKLVNEFCTENYLLYKCDLKQIKEIKKR